MRPVKEEPRRAPLLSGKKDKAVPKSKTAKNEAERPNAKVPRDMTKNKLKPKDKAKPLDDKQP